MKGAHEGSVSFWWTLLAALYGIPVATAQVVTFDDWAVRSTFVHFANLQAPATVDWNDWMVDVQNHPV